MQKLTDLDTSQLKLACVMMKLHLGLFSSSCSQYCKVKMGQTLTAAQLQDGYGIGLKAARKLLMVLLSILTGNST